MQSVRKANCQLEPAQGGTKGPQASILTVNCTISALFRLAQTAHSRLFVPEQQNAGLGLPSLRILNFFRVLDSRGRSKKAKEATQLLPKTGRQVLSTVLADNRHSGHFNRSTANELRSRGLRDSVTRLIDEALVEIPEKTASLYCTASPSRSS